MKYTCKITFIKQNRRCDSILQNRKSYNLQSISKKKMSFTSPTNGSTFQKLPSTGNYNNLISLQLDPQQLMSMPQPQKIQYFTKIKKQANYFLLNAFRSLQQKNYKQAKDILVYIADSCSCIHPPDKQSEELIQLCCEELAQIKRVQDWMNERKLTKGIQHNRNKKLELFVMKYNKFSGEFQCDESDKKNVNPEVLFYLTKINAKLFGEQTTENIHSMIAMLKFYSIQMFLTIILIMFLVLLQMTNLKTTLFKISQSTFNYPAMIICLSFLIPLLIIYFKSPTAKNSQFFELKLTEQIKKINQECRQLGKKILFMMPEGMELNVKVQHQIDDQNQEEEEKKRKQIEKQEQAMGIKIDLSRIRKRVTHYYERSKVDGIIEIVK